MEGEKQMSDRRIHRVRIVNARLKPGAMPKVTMHALLRYAERVCGFDIVKATLALSSPEVQRAILYGADAVVADGVKVVLKGSAVVTVLAGKQKVKKGDRVLKSFAELETA